MAIESVTADAGSGGADFATDEITGGVQVPYAKLMSGTDASEELIGGDAANGLDVDVTRSALPTGAATEAKQDTIIGHVDGIEALLGTIDSDTSNLSVVGGGTEATAIRVTIASDSTGVLSIDDNGGAITVDGTVTANAGTGTFAVSGPLTDAELRATAVPVSGTVTANAGTGTLAVSLASVPSHAVTNAGTFAVQVSSALPAGTNAIGKLSANSGVDIGDVDVLTLPNVTLAAGTNTNEVVGDAAHDAEIAGNPLRIAGRAMSADYTAVATGDTADLLATLLGKSVNLPYALPANTWSYASPSAVTDTADDEAKAAGAAGVRNYITGIQVFNGHDTVGTEVVIKDGSTVKWRGWAEQTGGGCSAVFNPPLRGTAATAVNVANITTGSSTYYNLQGFVAAE